MDSTTLALIYGIVLLLLGAAVMLPALIFFSGARLGSISFAFNTPAMADSDEAKRRGNFVGIVLLGIVGVFSWINGMVLVAFSAMLTNTQITVMAFICVLIVVFGIFVARKMAEDAARRYKQDLK